ncbi:DUF397 domain-containing protein [Streptomyces sp. R08]|uniref:DUF397 domain-containing protein n=1 Tax=Streptomyces sp. R08 TaxID=3238624 RepID=A0AB39MFQ2_9ACTN
MERYGGSGTRGALEPEIAIDPADAIVHIRDSKDTDRAQLAFADDAWTEFVAFASY